MHRKKRLILLFLALILLLDVCGTLVTLRTFRQFTLEPQVLYGENGANLKEFTLDEDGVLTAKTDDPWVYYALEQPANIRFVTVEISHVSGPDSDMQIYLLPSLGYRAAALTHGATTLRFWKSQGCMNVCELRMDLATATGTALTLDTVTVNRRMDVILDFQLMFTAALALLGLAAAELWVWYRLLSERQDDSAKRSRAGKQGFILLSAIVQAGLKGILFWLLRRQLLSYDGISRQHLLWWMLVLGLELFSIMAVSLGTEKRRKNIWFVYLLTIPFAFLWFSLAEVLTLMSFEFQNLFYLILNLLLCALIPAVLLFFLRRGTLAFSVSSLIYLVLTVANHYYGILRNNPLEYFDIANAGTAVHVISNYTLAPDREVAAAVIAVAVTILVLSASFGLTSCGYRLRTMAGNAFVVSMLGWFVFANLPVFGNFSNIQFISRDHGYLLSFASFIKMGQIKKPEGYSVEVAEDILTGLQETVGSEGGTVRAIGERLPNIIVIMNETLADMPEIYGFETEQDALPNIHSLTENTIHGRVLASVYGGGTANTEYEFLTGNSLYFFPVGSSPYVQYVGGHQQSLAWKLRNAGYSTAAYHPYLPISYRRAEAYPLLGLEPFYSVEDELPYEAYLRTYVNDQADFQNLIYLYEERDPEKPFFIFNVTMQNHGGYSNDEPAVPVTVKPLSNELQTPAFMEYLSLVHASDAAFQELVDYFSNVEEDTILLMFGDHQPSVEESVANALDQSLLERDGVLDSQRRYYATFVMWANFNIEEKEHVVTSPGFLRSLLLEQAGVPMNAYERFLLTLGKEYPTMNSFGYFDRLGAWHDRGASVDELLKQYQYLIYQNVFDKKNMKAGYYE
ncbi:MAG: LTA synthase family protein [Clostridium sp.]|nr:LTA synthase family protein [Clostridium sp.]MDY5483380.1 LTA synthase family protein [Clostridium sp.]